MKSTYGIAIHGGAGTILKKEMDTEKENAYRKALESALAAGEEVLKKKGSALDAVTAAVVCLEDHPLFNAGRGSVFTHDGTHEMDASLMKGDTLEAGAVACVKGIRNPVLAARAVMEKSEHVFLIGRGAEEFARLNGIAFESEGYFFNEHRYDQWRKAVSEGKIELDHTNEKKFGTVGAVAVDHYNNTAAATSTGGMTNKNYQRVGDSPMIGAGTYANNKTCAVSCTGHGEYFIRAVAAYDVSCLMEYKGLSLEAACNEVINSKLKPAGGEGGLIAVDRNGNISMPFNSEGMYRAFRKSNGEGGIYIYR